MSTNPENRVLSLFLPRKRYPSEYTRRYIMYRGSKLNLTDEMCDELLSNIPEVWNTDKDRLVQFCLMEDSTHVCVRNKDVYNFSIKETEQKTYFYNSSTDKQVSELIKIITDFFGKKKIQEVEDFYNVILESLSDMSYIKKNILVMREEALSRSDYMFNSDYTFSDIEMEEKWKTYRQEWRDITNTDAWINNDIMSLSLPDSPQPQKMLDIVVTGLRNSLSSISVTEKFMEDLKLSIDCSKYQDLFKNFGSISVKMELLKVISKLKIPFYNDSVPDSIDSIQTIESGLSSLNLIPMDIYTRYKNLTEIEGEDSRTSMKKILDDQIVNLDFKLESINNILKEYDVNFTISDILTKYVEDTNAKLKDMELQKEAEVLIADLGGEEL